MMSAQSTIERKLSRARTQLLLNQPFFGTLCLRLKLDAGSLPTMATDGRRIVYNAEFVEELRSAELEGVLAHEVLHCALAHQCRRGQRDPELWNRAADLAINPILIANGFKLPGDALIDQAFNNLSAEEIYARLARQSGCRRLQKMRRDPAREFRAQPDPQRDSPDRATSLCRHRRADHRSRPGPAFPSNRP